jgi:hypothetical protein
MSHYLLDVAGLAVLLALSIWPFRAFQRFMHRFRETSAGPSPFPASPSDPTHDGHR